MKKLLITVMVAFLSTGTLVAIVLAAIYGDITVSGAGATYVDGTYYEQAGSINGKAYWTTLDGGKGVYRISWELAGTGKLSEPEGWRFSYFDEKGALFGSYYYQTQVSNQPPRDNWVNSSAIYDPPPTLSGDGSLPVSLRSFTACPSDRGIRVSWVSESEIDHLGYILDRKTEIHDWETIASYVTHEHLLGSGNTSERKTYSVTDEEVEAGQTYSYRLSDVDINGTVTVKDVISITLAHPPEQTVLKPAFPNPFNPSTKIQYELANDTPVLLKVADITGRHVQTIVNGVHQSAGSYSVHWNGRTDSGIDAASGVYFLLLQAGDVRQSQKVMLVR
ncbi:T9SS type A sorting domain-containing protein [bacterium]|nr:T9SS type A sorting domain-containing protein [bacterium]